MSCEFIPYGDEENRCKKCGYITYRNDEKTNNEILTQMLKNGSPIPECYNIHSFGINSWAGHKSFNCIIINQTSKRSDVILLDECHIKGKKKFEKITVPNKYLTLKKP